MIKREYQYRDETLSLECEISKNTIKSLIDGETVEFDFIQVGPNQLLLTNGAITHKVYFAKDKESIHLFFAGEKFILKLPKTGSRFSGDISGIGGGKGLVEAPMPGTIIKFLVQEGDIVEIDQGLVIVEAMKMENEIRSTIRGRVKRINFTPGSAVDVGQSIIDLEEIMEEAL